MAVAIPAVSFWASSPEQAKMTATGNSTKYQPVVITNIAPADVLPIIWQIEAGDKKCYEHIEHLRVAEATRIRDMMWEYGAGNHSAEEYKQLMSRLNTGMKWEYPKWYDNYEIIEWEMLWTPSEHAAAERSILNILIDHTNFKILGTTPGEKREESMTRYIENNPNTINIFWCSAYDDASNKSDYDKWLNRESIKNLCKHNNFIIFAAGTNINSEEWHLRNRIYNGEYEANEYWWYSLASLSNSDKNTQPNSHLLVTIATNKNWNIDQTDVDWESSKYPVWFANNVLFSGRGFPQHREGVIYWPSWRYTTSDTNYFNVALAGLCFQMKADVADVDKLLEMIRSSALTDYIRLDGQTQELQLMNPAWFFQEYLMPLSLPTNLKLNEITSLEKGYYHGVVFQISGAEVNVNGQWIAFTNENKDFIFSQNPMNLEWRLNGELLSNYNYKPWDTISGQIIVVDDQWKGLTITKDFSVNVESASAIDTVAMPYATDTWFTIDGILLDAKPTIPGVYIVNGQKVTIK